MLVENGVSSQLTKLMVLMQVSSTTFVLPVVVAADAKNSASKTHQQEEDQLINLTSIIVMGASICPSPFL
eukprot:6010551-Amphidinium_carterae.1